jgi:hypothetical protein
VLLPGAAVLPRHLQLRIRHVQPWCTRACVARRVAACVARVLAWALALPRAP